VLLIVMYETQTWRGRPPGLEQDRAGNAPLRQCCSSPRLGLDQAIPLMTAENGADPVSERRGHTTEAGVSCR
jgi:hypothetical protein